MNISQKNRVRLSIETLEHRDAPAPLGISPLEWVDRPPTHGAQVSAAKTAKDKSHSQPFHAKDSGKVVITGDLGIGTIIDASASGQATHLGAFTLRDSSTVVGVDGPFRSIEGEAELEFKHGELLFATFTGTVDLSTFTASVTFTWAGGTGKFADATGTTEWQVTLNPADFTYTAVADGDIDY
jgi:hypothetical protein